MPLTELKTTPISVSSPEEHFFKTETTVIDDRQTIVRFRTENDYKKSLIIGEEIMSMAKRLYPEKYANSRNNI